MGDNDMNAEFAAIFERVTANIHVVSPEEFARMEREEKRAKYLRRLERSGIPQRFRGVQFGKLNSNVYPRQQQSVTAFVQSVANGDAVGHGLILSGDVGTGKTTLAVAAIDRFCQIGINAFFIQSGAIIGAILNKHNDDDSCKLRRSDVLVIDDFTVPKNDTEYGLLDELICHRYNNMQRTIITTNLTLAQMEETWNARILDRLRSTSQVLLFQGASLR